MAKLYGSLNNRIDEGHNYNKDGLIHEGDDVTMYHWSDRTCYFVTKVFSQEHIMVHKYHVCADHSKEGGMGRQNWLYFKTAAEMNKYLNSCLLKLDERKIAYDESAKEGGDTELMFRRGKWRVVSRYNLDRWEKAKEMAARNPKSGQPKEGMARFYFDLFKLTDKQFQRVMQGKEVLKFSEFGNISFGVRDYYYDWEF